jgi:hypothetical protein
MSQDERASEVASVTEQTPVPNLHRGQVFGPLVERNGVTLVPVARVRRSGAARAIGAWVVRDGKVEWQPAFDLTAVIVTSNAVAVVALIVLRRLLNRRAMPR